jgi:hypothetical protein
MKKIMLVLGVAFAQYTLADTCSVDKNVKDYFLSIPSDMLVIFDDIKGPLISESDRELAIKTFDEENNFIALQNDSIIAEVEIKLYRSNIGSPLLLITQDGVSVQNTSAFNCYDGRWHDVSDVVFPKLSIEKVAELYVNRQVKFQDENLDVQQAMMAAHTLVRYKLPKVGLEIQAYASQPDVIDPENSTLFEFVPDVDSLKWQG